MKAIITKYLGPTDRRGSRIKAYDCDKNSITVSYDSGSNCPELNAVNAFLARYKWGWKSAIRAYADRHLQVWNCADDSANTFYFKG